MKDKPKLKKEIALSTNVPSSRFLSGTGTNDALNDISEFGALMSYGSGQFNLTVDPRFDFDEVVEYIETYSDNYL